MIEMVDSLDRDRVMSAIHGLRKKMAELEAKIGETK